MTSVEIKYPDNQTFLKDVFFSETQKLVLQQFINEYEHKELLAQYHLPVAHKLLFYGKSGCGKTLTAKAIANQLQKKIIIINLGEIVSFRLGETAKNISSLFQKAKVSKSILFLDEFDSIGTERSNDSKDAGEMRRVVNMLLQKMDEMNHETILIAATNQLHLIDQALIRRFEHQVEFEVPNEKALNSYYDEYLEKYPSSCREIERIYNISYAEAENQILHQVKRNIIQEFGNNRSVVILE